MRRLPLLAFLGLLLAGCGNDSTSAPVVTVTATSTTTVTQTATVTPQPATPTVPVITPSVVTPSVVPTSAPTGDPSAPPMTYDAALAHFDAVGQEPVALQRFVTPSGNIFCSLDESAGPPGCELRSGAVKDPGTCQAAPTLFVGRVEFHDDRATAICNTDTIVVPGAPTLGYGEAARLPSGTVQCLSEKIGVTCISTKRTEGFFLRKGQYVIFNAG